MQARKSRGMSQEDLASMIGTKGPAIGRYERGVAKPTIEVAVKLADALGISLDFLVGKVDTEMDEATLKRIRDISVLPEDDRNFLLRAVDGLLRDIKTQKAYAS